MKRLICFLLALILPSCACARTVTIPKNTVVIEAEAFQGDESIAEVVIPNGVLQIGQNAFDGCDPDLLIRTGAGSAAMTYAQAHQIDYQADTTYRALLIGQCEYDSQTQLVGPATDVQAVANTLALYPGTPYQCTIKQNLTYAQFYQAIQQAFGSAREQDVSLLYYSGHGATGGKLVTKDNYGVSPATLRTWLDAIPGRKIVIVDACRSGALIGKSADSAQQSFAEAFIAAFSMVKRSLTSDSYYVITASRGTQDSAEVGDYTHGISYGLFSRHFCAGLGYDYFTQQAVQARADENGDGVITLDEAHRYAAQEAYKQYDGQEAQVYPENCIYQSVVRK